MRPQTYRMRIDGELITLEEGTNREALVTVGRVTIYGRTALVALEGVVELLDPDPAA
jgi:hypothetical protein